MPAAKTLSPPQNITPKTTISTGPLPTRLPFHLSRCSGFCDFDKYLPSRFRKLDQGRRRSFFTMSIVSLLGVQVLNNPAKFTDKYEFEITFECLEALEKDLEWKLTYVGSATSDQYDQELDSLFVGPVPVGVNKFVFEADAPNTSRIPDADILGVTVILLTCAYDGREFVRVGYYVNNEYDSEELNAEPPAKPIIERVKRNVLAEKPRVTRFAIKWDNEASAPAEFPPEQPEADLVADEEEYGADERDEEDEPEASIVGANGEKPAGEDAEMAGVENGEGDVAPAEEDEMSDDGSVDIEGESEDELEEEAEGEGEGADDDAMDVDSSSANKPAATISKAAEVIIR
ncbi:Histone chaperone [Colletotrichum higginsianum IMI 349063]|uniref:Anti-silencing function protein 1 n=3 Tax=Colletotrichum higginsianum TaxID=80884 RepID=A0A1B7YVN2_COLHI|nr:Histone chaperone [Colletotrichum higginsianum IMI 349063]OBR16100.1 Histone chaperone [Colletotrichum higginsianum IMI 349063]